MMAAVEKQASRRELLERQAARLEADRANAVERIETLRNREAELRVSGIRAEPGKRSDVGGAVSEVYGVVKEREKLERSLPGLDAEIAAMAVVLQELREEAAAALFSDALVGVREFDGHERRIIDALKAARAEFYGHFEELMALYAVRRDYVSGWALIEQAQVDQIKHEARPLWDPSPQSAAAAFDRLTLESERAADQPQVWVHLPLDRDPPPTIEEKREHYALVSAARANGATQPLPHYPELHAHESASEAEPTPEPAAVEDSSEDVPDGIVDAAPSRTGRKLFRLKGGVDA
jgi:hypothetical protein